jgi:hypothetical protein
MTEGWYLGDYLILFSADEQAQATEKYRLGKYLPGHSAVGLKGWDDFIVQEEKGGLLCLPTVPLDRSHAEPYSLHDVPALESDARFEGKIKWYIKPLVFGGSSEDDGNIAWVTHEQHRQLVIWWNECYETLRAQLSGTSPLSAPEVLQPPSPFSTRD